MFNPVSNSNDCVSDDLPTFRNKSTRSVYKPSYLQDYICNNIYTQHWCNLVSYHNQDKNHHCIAAAYNAHNEQKSYEEASKDPNWTTAMNKEIQALIDNQTWAVVDLLKGNKAIGSKWVYKIKLKSDGSLERLEIWHRLRRDYFTCHEDDNC